MNADSTNPYQTRRRLLPKGESLVAALGVGTLIILLGSLCAEAWWSVREQRALHEWARREQVHAVSELLGRSAETMLASGELSGLRRLVLEARREHRLRSCQIFLPDGRVLVDTEPSKVNVAAIPTSWPQGPLDLRPEASRPNEMAVTRSLLAPGRGPAVLCIRADIGGEMAGAFDLMAGLGATSIVALLALMLVYRRFRQHMMGLGLIREALLAFARGERSTQALGVAGNLGHEAAAWNGILQQIEKVQQDELTRSMPSGVDRRSEARSEMELVFDSLSVGLAIVGPDGQVRQANGAAASLLRIRREELLGRRFAEVLQDEKAKSAVEDVIGSSSPQRRRVEFTRQEEGVNSVLRLSVRSLRKEDGGSALVMIEDLTQQRIAETSRNSFVTQAAHELRTPLTNMRLCLESAMEEGVEDAAERAKCFNILNQETRRLERVITEFLSVTEMEAGAMKLRTDDVRLDSLFKELHADFESLATNKRIDLRFDLPPKFPVLQGDREKLVLAIHNLVGNAIKYTPDGGRVTVALRIEKDRICIDVADTGIGIPDEERELVFEKFYRAKDPRVAKITGSGLGLALSREVARFHGGDVTLQSELNRGSTFSLMVPMVSKAA